MRSIAESTSLALAALLICSVAYAQPSVVIDLDDVATDVRRLGRVHGSSGNGATGVPVAGGFDLDGDGVLDHALAAMRADPFGRVGAGEVHVVFGSGGFMGTVDTAGTSPDILKIAGRGPAEAAGSEIWMDDVTGDGIGDLLIARQNFSPDPERPGAGALTVVVGGPVLRDLAATGTYLDLAAPARGVELTTFVGAAATDRVGIWVRAGDVTGDGISDLLFGADQEDVLGQTDRGAMYLVRGGAELEQAGLIDLAEFGATELVGHIAKIVPPPGSHEFHFGATCAVADLDGNGRAEVLGAAALNRAGATLRADGAESGSAHGLGGSRDGTTFIVWDDNFPAGVWAPGLTIALDQAPGSVTAIEGADANRKFGEELLGGLDFDGDGTADLFVGDIIGDFSPGGNRNSAGSGHVFYNAASLKGASFDLETPPPGLETTTILGAALGDIAGDTAAQGDFDGDGAADLLVASPHARAAGRDGAGVLHVFFGGARWPTSIDLKSGLEPSSEQLRFTLVEGARGAVGSDSGDTLCYSAAAGDVDGDGRTDLIGNEMQGNGLAPEHVDVGNLILLSGALLAGDTGSGCPLRPATDCFATVTAASRLRLVDRRGRQQDRLTWRWREGEETQVSDFLTPDSDPDTLYSLCLYRSDDPQFDALSADAAGIGDCGGAPCWSSTGVGYRYEDPAGRAGGLLRLDLQAGQEGAARIRARAGGEHLLLPSGPFSASLIVQLRAANGPTVRCWESQFSDFMRNDGRVLRARGE